MRKIAVLVGLMTGLGWTDALAQPAPDTQPPPAGTPAPPVPIPTPSPPSPFEDEPPPAAPAAPAYVPVPCPPCPCDCTTVKVPAGVPPGGQAPGGAAPTATIAAGPVAAPFQRQGFLFGFGLGAAVVTDEVQGGTASGLQLGMRGGYTLSGGRLALMLDFNAGLTPLEGGGSFSATSLALVAQYFVRPDWAVMAGFGPGNVEMKRNGLVLQAYAGGMLQVGVSHDVWRHVARSNSLNVEARAALLSDAVLDMNSERAATAPGNDTAGLITLGGVYTFW